MEERQVMPGARPESTRKLWIISWIVLCFAGPPARSQPSSLVDVFKKVNPSVVEIHTRETYQLSGSNGTWMRVARLGSGVLVSRDGKVLTAAHLVQTADAIEVEFVTGEKVAAR